MSMIKITLEDQTYQYLLRELTDIQVREMKDRRWYVDEIKQARKKLDDRYKWLKENVL